VAAFVCVLICATMFPSRPRRDPGMAQPTSQMLDVPGARLHYKVQGSGPVLMFVGHPMGASGFAAIAPLFAEEYTVVTYDPRGFAPSTIEDPDQDGEPDLLESGAGGCWEWASARVRQ
jgi:pimeloyl-ACP methyl ester carboxylesterase